MRGTFGNIRLRNELVDKEGGYTIYLPEDEETTVYDAAMKYQEDGTPLVVLAGEQYGSGSSRDWAAKGTLLLGIKAVIAQSYERIHRSNLIGMGVLPLQFAEGEGAESLGLDGTETFDIEGISGLEPGSEVKVRATGEDGEEREFTTIARVDSPVEVEYLKNGGILHTVLRELLNEEQLEADGRRKERPVPEEGSRWPVIFPEAGLRLLEDFDVTTLSGEPPENDESY